ncbi:TlyA family RNA methyltransferase [Paludifilum halophilum]|uniref:TlyA family rRNA (Cytidine-2'-O)-methyltransferase n=1 Tax=Paludifilum halophilum TaxID=1642702 RepID=A0A235BC07_9BACL|nr:TlyA family RNA methyltransferase [Paludifilum halophilum]OYD09823.1 TlyA family rRNA (cytidine-2'-O)-methyltransferase [Paludifilum halophilum]
MPLSKERLDVLLVEKGFFESRQQAQRAIMAGLIRIDGERVDKAGTKVRQDARIQRIGNEHPYVSRGGLKLEKAIQAFSLDLSGRVVLDIGASTGGFTDCALQNGARRVYAVDVGYGQLAWKLRQDDRVVVMERTNFRYMKPGDLSGERPDFATIDVSFISLSRILPPLKTLLKESAQVVALVKPQFEAGRKQVGKKGIVRDSRIHREVLTRFSSMAGDEGFYLSGLVPSPITGAGGNIEFVSLLYRDSTQTTHSSAEVTAEIERAVKDAHESGSNH